MNNVDILSNEDRTKIAIVMQADQEIDSDTIIETLFNLAEDWDNARKEERSTQTTSST